MSNMCFGILNEIKKGVPYGPTKYWAECDGDRIEFTTLELADIRDRTDIKFHGLFDYIEGLFIKSDMSDEEYARVVARRTAADERAIEEKIKSGKR